MTNLRAYLKELSQDVFAGVKKLKDYLAAVHVASRAPLPTDTGPSSPEKSSSTEKVKESLKERVNLLADEVLNNKTDDGEEKTQSVGEHEERILSELVDKEENTSDEKYFYFSVIDARELIGPQIDLENIHIDLWHRVRARDIDLATSKLFPLYPQCQLAVALDSRQKEREHISVGLVIANLGVEIPQSLMHLAAMASTVNVNAEDFDETEEEDAAPNDWPDTLE
jgi:hypothetical protein